MAISYNQGGCNVSVQGAKAPAITPATAKAEVLYEDSDHPSWKTSRYPVSMEEYARMVEEARKPNPDTLVEVASDAESLDDEPAIAEGIADAALKAAVAAGSAPGVMDTFEGIGQTNSRPPDCTCAAGKTQVLMSVNSTLAVYTKAGKKEGSWAGLSSFFKNVLPSGMRVFDPRIMYDHFTDRFIVIAIATNNSANKALLLIGVSDTDDACGSYWVWATDATLDDNTATNNWGDYPMVGYDENAIYVMLNMFQFNGSFQYCKLRIHNKSELMAGGVGTNHEIKYWDIWNIKDGGSRLAFSINPCIHYRTAGTNLPGYMVSAIWANSSSLNVWKISDVLKGWATPAGTPTMTVNSVACKSYSMPPHAEQKDSTTLIATNDTRLLSGVYMDDGTNESIWTCHTSQVTWPGEPVARCGGQWYQINVQTNTIVQQSIVGKWGQYYYFPAITVDQRGSAYMVIGRSSDTEFPSLRETGRRPSDPLGEMRVSTQLRAGDTYYATGNPQRWGDYFTAVRDGQDKYKVWVYGEFSVANTSWGTWCASLRI